MNNTVQNQNYFYRTIFLQLLTILLCEDHYGYSRVTPSSLRVDHNGDLYKLERVETSDVEHCDTQWNCDFVLHSRNIS